MKLRIICRKHNVCHALEQLSHTTISFGWVVRLVEMKNKVFDFTKLCRASFTFQIRLASVCIFGYISMWTDSTRDIRAKTSDGTYQWWLKSVYWTVLGASWKEGLRIFFSMRPLEGLHTRSILMLLKLRIWKIFGSIISSVLLLKFVW